MSTSRGHAVRRLTEQEIRLNSERGYTCSSGKCKNPPTHATRYSYVTGRAGRVSWSEREVCTPHAEKFAAKHGIEITDAAKPQHALQRLLAAGGMKSQADDGHSTGSAAAHASRTSNHTDLRAASPGTSGGMAAADPPHPGIPDTEPETSQAHQPHPTESSAGSGDYGQIHDAVARLAGVCDFAESLDGQGFNATDTWLGHVLAAMPVSSWTDDEALAAWDMLRKYRGQLDGFGISYDGLPKPPGAGELIESRRAHTREQARLHGRKWRREQYRRQQSYVRCDGEGDDVVLAFPYDAALIEQARGIKGRRFDWGTKTSVFPFTSLAPVIEFAGRHGIDVAPEVRALAIAAAVQAQHDAARPNVYADSPGQVVIRAGYDPRLNDALKELNGGRSTWDRQARVHRPPLRRDPGQVLAIAAEFGLTVGEDARAAIEAEIARQDRNRAAASAVEAPAITIPGLAARLSLKPQQYPVVAFALEHRRVLIGDDMGWGKTLSSLAAVAAGGAYPAVVVCRPSLTLNWVAEIRRFFPALSVYEASGTTPQPVPDGTDIVVIGSAALAAKPRKTKDGGKQFGWVQALTAAEPKALIIDEGQDTKERGANRSQACEQLAQAVIARDGLVLDLTGTAILNRPRELCQQLAILGRIGEFGGPQAFLWRYCLAETSEWGASYNGARNLTELHQRLLAWGIMIRRSDDAALGLPPCREHVLRIGAAELDPAVMARYRQAEADLLGFLAGQARAAAQRLGKDPNHAAVQAVMRAAAAEHLVAINTLRQLAGQAKRGYVTAWTRARVQAGEKVMVAAHHREEVDAYAAAFGGLKLQGGQPVQEKEAAKAAFQQLPAGQAPVIAVAIGAGGVGHTLTAAATGIQAEQAWTPGDTQQMKKRLHRIGQNRPVDYYITVAGHTIDEQLWEVVTAKQATLNAVLDGRSDEGTADDAASVAAELTWRLTQQGLDGPAGGGRGQLDDGDSGRDGAGLRVPPGLPVGNGAAPGRTAGAGGSGQQVPSVRGSGANAACATQGASSTAAPGQRRPGATLARGDPAEDGDASSPGAAQVLARRSRVTRYTRDCTGQALTVHAPRPGEFDQALFAAFATGEAVLGLDVETSAVEDDGARQFDPGFTVRLVQFGSEREAWVLDLADPAQRDAAAAVLADPARRFVTHTPFDVLAVWSAFGIPLGQRVADTHLLSKLVNPDERAGHGLKELSGRHLDRGLSQAEEALHARMWAAAPPGHRTGNAWLRWGWNHLPADDEAYAVYAGLDAIYVRRLLPVLLRQCAPFAHLAPMEMWLGAQATGIAVRGLLLDRPYATALLTELEAERRGPEAAITAALGCPPGSPRFAEWLDSQTAAAGITGLARTKTGQLETSADALDALLREHRSALPAEVMDLVKARLAVACTSNLIANVRGFLAAADPSGRVHPQIKTLRAKTARMSVTGPALQTLKKHDPRLRRCFQADPGHVLISCDFSQVEARVAAALANDTALKQALASGDIHGATAELMYGPGYTDQQRDISKRATYGTIFGGGATALAAQTGVSEDAAREVIQRWRRAYPQVTAYGRRLATLTEVVTASGRRIPADPARPYASANYAIQSTARDLLLAAVYTLVTRHNVGGLWLFVHDEVIVQAPEQDAERVRGLLQQAMTGAFRGVPILAEAKIVGPTWGHIDTPPGAAAPARTDRSVRPGTERAQEGMRADGAPAQAALFGLGAAQASKPVSGLPAGRFAPAASDAALAGDGYQWLRALLPALQPPACETCGQPMRLPAAAPILWTCPACHPGDAAPGPGSSRAGGGQCLPAAPAPPAAARADGADSDGTDGQPSGEPQISHAARLRDAAHHYLGHGLQPVPAWGCTPAGECCCPRGGGCPRPGKHPRAVHAGPGPADYSWKPLACSTPQEIDQRFADRGPYAGANLMLAIPPGMMAIDQDNDDGGRQAAAELAGKLGELPPTLTHPTPHGTHRIYRTPPGWTGRAWVGKDTRNPLPAGIDLRMPGQILMAPPSRVPTGNGPASYGPASGTGVADLPAAYLQAWTPPTQQTRPAAGPAPVPPGSGDRVAAYLRRSIDAITAGLANHPPGGRNTAIYTAALKTGSLLGAARAAPGAGQAASAWTGEAAEQALMTAAQQNGYIGAHGASLARSAIRSGLRNGLRDPRALPDFSPAPRSPATAGPRPPRQQPPGPATAPGGSAAQPGHWQQQVPDGIRRHVEAADRAARQRHEAAQGAYKRELEHHNRSGGSPAATGELRRARNEMIAAQEAYTRDGRHTAGRHQAAMLRWAASVAAEREHAAETPRARANRAAVAANQAYRAGDLERAQQLTGQAAALDPSRADLWQQHRTEIAAKRLFLAARTAHAEGNHSQAQKLMEDARQLDPRMQMIWDRHLSGTQTSQRTPARRQQAAPGGPDRAGKDTPAPPARNAQPGTNPPQPGQPARRISTESKHPAPAAGAPGTPPAATARGWRPQPIRRQTQPQDAQPGSQTSEPAAAPEPPPASGPGRKQASAQGRQPGPAARAPEPEPHRHVTSPRPVANAPDTVMRQAESADWRDTVIESGRQAWQPQVVQPYTPSPSPPQATGPEIQ